MGNRLKDLILGAQDEVYEPVYEPSLETLRINNVLEPLGFNHGGEFYPIEFDVDSFEWIAGYIYGIAYTDNYIAILNYSIMEYWEIHKNDSALLAMTQKAVKELEGING